MTPRISRRTVLQGGAASALALLVAACGGDDNSSSTTTTTTTEPAPTTTRATTTTAATTTSTAPSTSAATTTTVPAEPVMPLTGVPIADPVLAARPAMVVKIDNHPEARPQFGLNAADIVFEENVESLTRFAAVFQSQDLDRVGPVRSGRTQDIDLLGALDHPMFVWSGGNGRVTAAINASDLENLSPTATRNVGFRRIKRGSEHSEHTLYANPIELRAAFTQVFAPAPPQQFTYRREGEAVGGVASPGAKVAMDNVPVTWNWDAAGSQYLREMSGRAHEDAMLGQVNAANVVVLEVDYRPSPADARSPEAQTVGTGVVHVLTAGVLVTGTWTRADRLAPFTLTAEDGSTIALTPGRTWVELARTGTLTPL